MFKLTKAQTLLVFHALDDAIQDRQGLADAHKFTCEMKTRCLKAVKKYRALRKELADHLGLDERNGLEIAIDGAEEISITEFVRRKGKV